MADRVFPSAPPAPTGPAPNGAYYNMKDQPMPPPATYRNRRRNRSCCCSPCARCLWCIFGTLATLIFLLGLLVLIFWLAVDPRAPQFNVESVFITGLSPNSTTQNTDIFYQIKAYNPNKHMDFYYSEIKANVTANGQEIGAGNITSFNQGHKETTNISGQFITKDLTVSTGTIQFVTKNLTYVPLYAEVDSKAKLKVWGMKSGKFKVKVKCNVWVDLTVTDPTGSMLKKSDCNVDW